MSFTLMVIEYVAANFGRGTSKLSRSPSASSLGVERVLHKHVVAVAEIHDRQVGQVLPFDVVLLER